MASSRGLIAIRLARNTGETGHAFRIRRIVFMNEQGVSSRLEYDGFDAGSKHVLLFYRSKPVGAARIRANGNAAKLERIAILKSYRGKGLGKALTKWLMAYCRRKGFGVVRIHAQYCLKEFYRNLGFSPRGKIFKEAGIRHVEMSMRLK